VYVAILLVWMDTFCNGLSFKVSRCFLVFSLWYFGIADMKLRIAKRKLTFLAKFSNVENEVCKLFADVGMREYTVLSIEVKHMLSFVN